ncbi:BID domain-containing T4SS effector [Bartonella sp. 1-1C]|uniref:BID domain-containing T4SS effector n=1 Tax=Bartonella sp. 1-1C TaxID=515256 RepID=UPI000C05B59E|nr:BID domain-containing T4SS effector [Bartonella sp. 1-1C]ATO57482.1 Bartonella effector protein Bep7/1 [Bartonella sp. 1-1C]
MKKKNLKSLKKIFKPLRKKGEELLDLSSCCDYTYPDSDTLINKHGIKNSQALDEKCAYHSEQAIIRLRREALPNKFNSSYLKHIHKCLFEDTFEWAGYTRDLTFKFKNGVTANISKMQIPNTDAFFKESKAVSKSLHKFDQVLSKKNNLQGLSREEFVDEATKLFSFLNYIHPFRDGNGRAQRIFFEKLAEAAGHKLDFSVVTQRRMIHACNDAIPVKNNVNYEAMQHLFEDISNPEKRRILKDYLHSVSNNKHACNFLDDQIIITPREGVTYTGIYKDSNADSIIVETVDLYIICCKDYFTPEQLKALKPNDKLTFTVPINKDLDQILIPAERLPPLTLEKILRTIENHTELQNNRKEIENLSQIVYGNSKVLNPSIDVINKGREVSKKIPEQILKYPRTIAKLAGFKIFGIRTPRRRIAERNLVPLSQEIKNYISAVQANRNVIIRNYDVEQKRLLQEITLPRELMRDVLSIQSKRAKALNTENCVKTQKELISFLSKVESRLSRTEYQALKAGDYKQIAQSIGMSEHKAKKLIGTVNQVKKVYQQLQQLKVNKSVQMAVAV